MISGFTNIRKDFFTEKSNFWEINPHMIYVDPFSSLYDNDTSKNKNQSSKDMWCILWMCDPDEEVNKYYRMNKELRIETCKNFNPSFDVDDIYIQQCMVQYEFLCLSADERAYKLQKDQLIQISQFLSSQEITLETAKEIIDLKAKIPKIYQDFEKIEKLFIKAKSDQRVHGGRGLTKTEKGDLEPDDE